MKITLKSTVLSWLSCRLTPVLKTIFINVSNHILVASLTLVALFYKTEPSELDWLQVLTHWWKIVIGTGASLTFLCLCSVCQKRTGWGHEATWTWTWTPMDPPPPKKKKKKKNVTLLSSGDIALSIHTHQTSNFISWLMASDLTFCMHIRCIGSLSQIGLNKEREKKKGWRWANQNKSRIVRESYFIPAVALFMQ